MTEQNSNMAVPLWNVSCLVYAWRDQVYTKLFQKSESNLPKCLQTATGKNECLPKPD